MLQHHWTGKVKAIIVFALRLPSVPSLIERTTVQSSHLSTQDHCHSHIPTPFSPRLPCLYRPSPRPHRHHSLDTRRDDVQPRHSSSANSDAVPDQDEYWPRRIFPRRLHQADDPTRVRRQLCHAITEISAEWKSNAIGQRQFPVNGGQPERAEAKHIE